MSYSKCHLGQLSVDKKIQENVIYTIAIKKAIYKPVVNHFFHPHHVTKLARKNNLRRKKSERGLGNLKTTGTSCSGYHSHLVLKLSNLARSMSSVREICQGST